MDGEVVAYKSPRHVQVLFLKRSRNKLREKYRELKDDQKRLQNGVRDVSKSREQWRSKAEALEAQVAELQQELLVLKKRADFFAGADDGSSQ